MPKILTKAQVEQYQSGGYVAPINALSSSEVDAFLDAMTSMERETPNAWANSKGKPHLVMKWVNDLMRHPSILGAVSDVLGPNVLAWASGCFDKKPFDPGFVSWHQDATYWGLSKPSVVTAWIALTHSNEENGCMKVIPGTHLEGQLPHRETFAEGNLLSRGQDIEVEVDETSAVNLELTPGQFSLHHTMLVHGSKPNNSPHRRLGLTIRYIAADVEQTTPFRDSATLVLGVDQVKSFSMEPTPKHNFDPECVAFYGDIISDIQKRKDAIAAGNM